MENRLLMGAPVPAPQPGAAAGAPAAPAPSPEQIASARGELGVVMRSLQGLAAKPKGSLSKRDVYDAVADMIGQGAFSTPQAKQQLVAMLAEIPDDEAAIRQAVGQKLLGVAQMTEGFARMYPEAPDV